MPMLLDNRRKAATMLVALGPERAAEILRTLDDQQAHALLAEITAVGPVSPEDAAAVLREAAEAILQRRQVKEGGLGYARELAVLALGPDRAAELTQELDPNSNRAFGYLVGVDPELAAKALAPEPPPSIALALACLDPEEATGILTHLPDELQGDVAMRMASLARTHPDVITEVEADLAKRVTPLLEQQVADIPGMENLVTILNKVPKERSTQILEEIEERDPELAARIRDSLFVFEDLRLLDDMAIQQVLKTVDTRDLSVAMKDADPTVTERILKNLSERARENLVEEIEFLKNVKKSDQEEARKKVVRVVRQLEDAGTIVIERDEA